MKKRITEGTAWPFNNETGGWNVKKAEERISGIQRFANMPKNIADVLIPQLTKSDPGYGKLITKAADEMREILTDKENGHGYHLNHMESSKTVFAVYDNSEGVYISTAGDEYSTREEAEEAAKDLPETEIRIEETDGKWIVMHFDQCESESCWENEWGGKFINEFATLEDAEAELKKYSHGYIREFPAEEWWTVVSNGPKRNIFQMFFPTERRALAFLYREVPFENWTAYTRCLEEKLAETEGK